MHEACQKRALEPNNKGHHGMMQWQHSPIDMLKSIAGPPLDIYSGVCLWPF